MKVWIDQDLCTGDGLCEEIAPEVFRLLDDGLAYVMPQLKENGQPERKGVDALETVLVDLGRKVLEASIECPGECIFIVREDGDDPSMYEETQI